MNAALAARLSFDLAAAGLLLFGLSYWWLGGNAHEAAGLAMFLLVVLHNGFNRRWYGHAARSRHAPASLFNVGVTLALVAAMLLLLATSALITTMLPEWLPPGAAFTARQIHVLAAYWAFVVVAIHLGLRWTMLMGIARRLFGILRPNRVRTIALRLATLAIAACGLWSVFALQLGTRLTMQVSLDWWNFEESVLGFFLHCIAAAGLLMASSHYLAMLLRTRTPPCRKLAAEPNVRLRLPLLEHEARSDRRN